MNATHLIQILAPALAGLGATGIGLIPVLAVRALIPQGHEDES